MRMKMYATIYGNIYRETLWEVNMEYIPIFTLFSGDR